MAKKIRRIGVITGDPRLADPTKRNAQYNEEDAATHNAMKAAFQELSDYTFLFYDDHARLFEQLQQDRPDLVVNFCDTGFRNVPAQELNIPAYLEMLGIPYTGAPPSAMVICFDKAIVRLVAQSHGVPVPREYFIDSRDSLEALPDFYPALIKPNAADGSVGITKDAVVRSPEKARTYLDWLRSTLPGRDALMQEYLPGPEYGFGVIGNLETNFCILPPLEVDFSRLPAGLDPILSFESKAYPDSPYWTDIKFKQAVLDPGLEEQMKDWVRILFRRFGLRDYARFDFRVGSDGMPKLMEVNPNPAWAYDGKLAFMAGFAGIKYGEMLHKILQAAINRMTVATS
ncbi:D-alanine--D-alanine ligase family protein [Nitrospira sp. T9]|uniref:D-alanine--D-alanine ligase family protein n=1 Tax=unclassified Nitrospira TaxID=2652172 RepID=UPI003F983DC3